jgi:KAP family P-loop domain
MRPITEARPIPGPQDALPGQEPQEAQPLREPQPPIREKKLFFVVAADGRWIVRSYEVAHAAFADHVREPGRPLGYLFLDKLFQLTVPVPRLGSQLQVQYLAGMLNTEVQPRAPNPELKQRVLESKTEDEVIDALSAASPEERIEVAPIAVWHLSKPRVTAETEHVLQAYAHMLDPNPRSMKRFLLAYSIARAVRTVEGSAVSRDSLARWTILRIRWPELAEHLRREPDAIAESSRDTLPQALRELMANAGVRDVLRQLTSQSIREATETGASAGQRWASE